MDDEEKCDIENPCDDGFSCDLDKLRCVSTVEQPIPLPPGIIETNIGGRSFVGKYETILRIIASHYGKLKDEDIKCSTGLDVILYEEFNDELFTKLQDDYSDLISFIDVGSGKILCSVKSQLFQYWKAKPDSYRGFEAQPGEDIMSKKLDIMRGERDHTNYLNFDMWTTKFITAEQAQKIKDSRDNLFLLIPIQFRYYDTNPSRVGAHHNFDTGGDSLYLVATIKTIGKELIEAELSPLEIINKITGKHYSNVEDVDELLLNNERYHLEDLINIINNIGVFTNLTWLHIENSDITSLPESIGNLRRLDTLYLNDNKLKTLPESIGNLTNLMELRLQDNELETLPESIVNLTELEVLRLENNKLETLPESIGNLTTNLTYLNLSNNKLETLPESIGNLTELEVLQLENNKLETLPESIGNLTNLTELNLSNNKLETLPESIGNLTKLTYLNLINNKLETLPESIGNLTNLMELSLENNPQLDRESIPENLREI